MVDCKDKLAYTNKIQNSNYISDDSAFKETLKQVDRTKKRAIYSVNNNAKSHALFDKRLSKHNKSFRGSNEE